MDIRVKDIVRDLHLNKNDANGMYLKVTDMIQNDESFSDKLIEFANDLETMLDYSKIKQEAELDKRMSKDAEEELKVEIGVYTLSLFLLFMERNKMIKIFDKEKRMAKDIFLTFEKSMNKNV